jgi:acyl carrier protein
MANEPTVDRQLFVDALTQYLVRKRPQKEAPAPAANLWALGYLDSLSIVELVLFIENVTGSELSVGDVDSLQSIDAIYDYYVRSRDTVA